MDDERRISLEGLTAYQRREVKKLTDDGWTVVGVRRLQNELNPWASLDLLSPRGEEYLTAVPVSRAESDYLTRVTW